MRWRGRNPSDRGSAAAAAVRAVPGGRIFLLVSSRMASVTTIAWTSESPIPVEAGVAGPRVVWGIRIDRGENGSVLSAPGL